MKVFVVVRTGWWWPDRSNIATLAECTRLVLACHTYEAARRVMTSLPEEPGWFVGDVVIDGKLTGCVLCSGINEVELTED
jgi:hypothetical protein